MRRKEHHKKGVNQVNKENEHRRSPLKDRPLRYAGQSIDEQINRSYNDLVLVYWIAVAAVAAVLAIWIQVLTAPHGYPWASTLLAIGAVVYAAVRIPKIRQTIVSLKLGR